MAIRVAAEEGPDKFFDLLQPRADAVGDSAILDGRARRRLAVHRRLCRPGPCLDRHRHDSPTSASPRVSKARRRRRLRAARRHAGDSDAGAPGQRRPPRGRKRIYPRRDGGRQSSRRRTRSPAIFELRDTFEWRGLGDSRRARCACARSSRPYDAERRFDIVTRPARDNPACECGAILRGVKRRTRLQTVRHALHAGDADGRLHGVVRRLLRGALDLWPIPRRAPTREKGGLVTIRKPFGRKLDLRTAASISRTAPAGAPWRSSSPIFFTRPSTTTGCARATIRPSSTSPPGRMVMTTDGYVVSPLFFPGGDIGSLAVHRHDQRPRHGRRAPLYMSASFIIEEGFPLADLARIARSMGDGCARGRRPDHHRRHQGGRARQGRWRVHLHRRRRRRPGGARSFGRPRAAGRRRSVVGLDRRSWRRHHVEARESCNSRRRSSPIPPRCTVLSRRWSRRRARRSALMRDPTRGGLAATLNEIAHQSRRRRPHRGRRRSGQAGSGGGLRTTRPRSALRRQ